MMTHDAMDVSLFCKVGAYVSMWENLLNARVSKSKSGGSMEDVRVCQYLLCCWTAVCSSLVNEISLQLQQSSSQMF